MHTAPENLGENALRWWRAVHDEYELGASEAALVDLAAQALDRHDRAVEAMAGEVLESTEFGKKQHPAATIARDALNSFRQCVRDLDLDDESQAVRPGNNVRHIRDLK